MKANEMHYFSDLFDKVLYMFLTGPLPSIRIISTLYTQNSYLSCQFCWRLRQQTPTDRYLLHVYSVEILLMMDSGPVRNMYSTLSNKSEKQCFSLALIVRICHDARSSEYQFRQYSNWSVYLGEFSAFHSRVLQDSTLLAYDAALLGNGISGQIPVEDNPKLYT